ncbi:AAA family ATPase [Primorskyibacter sp. 2E107]|uniref:AAA family ATPase n=1 Tax=Primorskyibacter sp. 2E107 TaxID=3403458 RepID=UPI003AF9276C
MSDDTRLHMLCGKICAGKSTLARALAQRSGTVVIAEDDWLSRLYGDQMRTIDDYVRCSAALQGVMGPHVAALLGAGGTVVLDFPANTKGQRRWMRRIVEQTGVGHALHVLDLPDEVLLARLRERNASGTHPFAVSDAEFRAISAHFQPPDAEEGFAIVRHGGGADG